MTKAELVATVAEQSGIEKSAAVKAVEATIEVIKNELVHGEGVITLRGFAIIKRRTLASRKARVITTGEEVIVPQQRTVKIKLSKDFKKELNKKQ